MGVSRWSDSGEVRGRGEGGGIVPLLTKIMYLACIRGSMTGTLLEGKRKSIGWLKRESEEERRKEGKKKTPCYSVPWGKTCSPTHL